MPRRTRFVHESGDLAFKLMMACLVSILVLKALSLSELSPLVRFLAAGAALGLLLAGLSYMLYSRARILLSRRAAMLDRVEFAEALLPALRRGADIEFSLFLRPFFTDDVFKWKSRGRYAQDSRSFWQFGGKLDLEESLAVAIDRACPLVAVGGADKGYGPPEMRVGDARWQEEVALLIDKARLIVAVPFAQPATKWEIERIVRRGHLSKTIFLIPPFRRRTRLRKTFAGTNRRAADIYHDSLREFATLGLDLPRVDYGGGMVWQDRFCSEWVVSQFRSQYDFEPSCLRKLLFKKLGTSPRTVGRDWYLY